MIEAAVQYCRRLEQNGAHHLRASVVIAVRDGLPYLEEQLEALARQLPNCDWELLLADNGSTDGTVATASRYAGRLPLTIIEAAAEKGAAAARNAAAAQATGDVLLFCDADDIVADDWIAQMCLALELAPIVGGRLEVERLNTPETLFARADPPDPSMSTLGFLPAALGANLGIRTSVFRSLGGFDSTFKGVAEDTDLCWRAQLHGNPFRYASDAVVHYRYRANSVGSLRQARQYGRGVVQLLARHNQHFEPDTFGARVRTALWVTTRLPNLALGRRRRTRYLRVVAHLLGQLDASRSSGFRHVAMEPPRVRGEGHPRT